MARMPDLSRRTVLGLGASAVGVYALDMLFQPGISRAMPPPAPLDPAPATLSALKALLGELDGRLGAALDGPGVRAAVDRSIAPGDPSLRPGSEVAFLPPMSGG